MKRKPKRKPTLPTTKKAASSAVTIRLQHLAEVADLRQVSWNMDWLWSVHKVWGLRPGEGVLFVNRAHDRLRAVVMLDEPILICFPVNAERQREVFNLTVARLISGKAVNLSLLARQVLSRQEWHRLEDRRRGARVKVAVAA